MTRYRLRLVEQSMLEDSGDFIVEADTPELAAAVLLRAHDAAREACRDLVVLPDGQSRRIEPRKVVDNNVFCIRLDDAGDEVGGEIKPDDRPLPVDTDRQDSAGPSNMEPQP